MYMLSKYFSGDLSSEEDFQPLLNCEIWDPMVKRFITFNMENQITYASISYESRNYQIVIGDDFAEIILGNVDAKSMRIWRGANLNHCQELSLPDVQSDGIIDLELTGKRWEGGVLNGEPFGFGLMYNDANNIIYRGFYWNRKPVCYGETFFQSRNLQYRGSLNYEFKNGEGVLYDNRGLVEYSGMWTCDYPVKTSFHFPNIHSYLEEFVIADDSLNDECITLLQLEYMAKLRRIVIGKHCFNQVNTTIINELKALECIEIGEECFNPYSETDPDMREERDNGEMEEEEESDEENDDEEEDDYFEDDYYEDDYFEDDYFEEEYGSDMTEEDVDLVPYKGQLTITNCPCLQSIEIRNHSFVDATNCKMTNLPALQSISFGEECFWPAQKFILRGMYFLLLIIIDMPLLTQITLKAFAFDYFEEAVLESTCNFEPLILDLPSLTTIELGEGALQGNGNSEKTKSEEEPFYYTNTVILRSNFFFSLSKLSLLSRSSSSFLFSWRRE